MNSQPSGTVTFLFTDIEGSTKLAQGHPDKWESLRERHHAILQSAIESHNGYVFQIIGDAFCAAFHTAKDGLTAALEAQRAFQTSEVSENSEVLLRVRMGLHTGSAELIGNDYRGYLTMAKVQRVMSVAYGGQILLSNTSAELIHNELPEGITLRDMKEHRLKGLLNPEHLWQIVARDLQQDFPPLQSLYETPNNLPIQLTSFIGRENEIAEVKEALCSPLHAGDGLGRRTEPVEVVREHRLVTLIGSGGTGKTRLCLQVAAELRASFPNGVWFIELAPLTDPVLIPQTILSAIGVHEQQGKTPLEALKEYLHEKQTLIVLDNCEHLVSASAQVANALLNAAPRLKVLASSREALGVKGELSYLVPSLSSPDVKRLPAIEQFSQYEAVRLFIDRALLVAPHFEVDKDNASFIAQICYRLDGIPLAIELAAARIKMLSVEQISKRLDDRFRLLTGGARTALPRQQTLRALIDWSYDILSDNERLLLRRLSIFAGGWTLEAAEEVCVGQDDILPYDILDLLSQLVNKSLVVVMEQSQGRETRYRMLETIRQYAREKMLGAGGSEIVRDKHLTYFVKLVEQAEPELYQGNQVFWFNKLKDELDNLRMALEWALATNVEAGLRIASIPYRFWDGYGHLKEMGKWLAEFLKHYDKTDRLHVQALITSSMGVFRQGNFPEAIKSINQSVQMARALSDQQLEAFGLSFLGAITQLQGNVEDGTPILEQGLALHRATGNKIGQANALEWITYDHTNMERSIAFARESLSLHRELNNLTGIAATLIVLARLLLWSGDFSSPVSWLEEALSITQQLDDREGELGVLATSGMLSYWQGDHQYAIPYFEKAMAISEEIGDQYSSSWIHVRMAHVFLRQGDLERAQELFAFGIKKTHTENFTIALVYAIEGLASLNVIMEYPERAARLFAWADAMREKIGDIRPPVEQNLVECDLDVIHAKLDDTQFAEFSAEGRAMTTEQAVVLALEEII